MSDPLRVAIAAEGPTDVIVVGSILRSVLGNRPFVLTQLQPEGSVAFGTRGGGWGGVYKWCKASAQRGLGRMSQDALVFANFDALVLHVDADVASCAYEEANIVPEESDLSLPCEEPCPPPAASVDRLRNVILSWCGETAVPSRTTLCVPSKNTEAWVLAMVVPQDPLVTSGTLECNPDPAGRFSQQKAAVRFKKAQRDYKDRADAMTTSWPALIASGRVSQAIRFQQEFVASVPEVLQ
jgi:hypothetical protein